MAKLYPPGLEGTIPAFYGATIVVPFSINPAVSPNEITGLVLKIKKVNSNEVILTKNNSYYDATEKFQAHFILTSEELKLFNIGQFYRAQIAFIDNNNITGYFSTVGVIKYTGFPIVEILDLERLNSNFHLYDYVGSYTQEIDPSEKLYSSRFYIYNQSGEIIKDSGEIIHSVLNDITPNQAFENFNYFDDIKSKEIYRIRFIVKTVNGVIASSPRYKIVQRENKDTEFEELVKFKIIAENSFDMGSTYVRFEPIQDYTEVFSGNFEIARSLNKEPYAWEKIKRVFIKSEKIDEVRFYDYTVEQGKEYIYSIRQYNNYGIYSKRLISNPVYADFEDMFLIDGKKQLKIRFNPKVSSMKDTLVENKVNTLGSKYPFITRSGVVNYKEFALSGLISYQMDSNRQFISWKELGLEHNITDLISENIAAERDFKLKVLAWLNDGKPKILKSPSEGNYIVRLMGISLSPNDTLGRMLHTFSGNASEIAPYDYNSLKKYNFLDLLEPDNYVTKIKTINLSYQDAEGKIQYVGGELLESPVYTFSVRDLIPGSKIIINRTPKKVEETIEEYQSRNEELVIGATGAYSTRTTSPIYSIIIPNATEQMLSGILTYEYRDKYSTKFDNIRNIELFEIPVHQIIGNQGAKENLIENIEDVKTKINSMVKAVFKKRGIHKIYAIYDEVQTVVDNKKVITTEAKFYMDGMNKENQIQLTDLEDTSLYEIHWSKVGLKQTYDPITKEVRYTPDNGETLFSPYTEQYFDPKRGIIIEDSYDLFEIKVNNEYLNLNEKEEIEIKHINFKEIYIGDGIIAELTYLTQVVEYSYEQEDPIIHNIYSSYKNLLAGYYESIRKDNDEDIELYYNILITFYRGLIRELELRIAEEHERG